MARDLRLLGWRAPLRGVHEAARRAHLYDAVLPRWARRGAAGPLTPSPPSPREVPAAARQRSVAEAERIVGGEIRLFDSWLALGSPPRWAADPHTGAVWADASPWSLALEGPDAPADPKWVWELGRHRHLVVLARAAWSEPEDDRFLDGLTAQVRSWFAAVAPERGIHWASNLEVALRALSWLEVLHLVGPRLPADVIGLLTDGLWHSGRHLVVELPHTLSMQTNNHQLGDAVGLVAVGRAFGRHRTGRVWARLGDAVIERWLPAAVTPWGLTIEDSLGYQRFVIDLLVARVRLGDDTPAASASAEAAGRIASALARQGVLAGPVPTYGDDDGGRALHTSQGDGDLAGSVRAGLAVAGTGAPAAWRGAHDECAWYVPEGDPLVGPVAVTDGPADPVLARVEQGRILAFCKGGVGTSHAHADRTSVAVAWDGRWVLGDPGTFHYNEPLVERDRFRSATAHDVVRLEGTDQLGPDRQFRWRHTATARLGRPVRLADGRARLVWCAHDAYRRLEPPRRMVRAVWVGETAVVVIDWAEDPSGGAAVVPWQLALPLAPGWQAVGDELRHEDGTVLALLVDGAPYRAIERGGPFADGGWWSPGYGRAVEATRLELAGERLPLVWGVGVDPLPPIGVDQRAAVVDGVVLVPHFAPDVVRLEVVDVDRTWSATVPVGIG